jgi:transcriptional regulator with XRE-family HTH domain
MDTTERIRRLVTKGRLTQYRIAHACGLDVAQLNRFATRRVKGLTVKSADRILAAMGYKLEIVKVKRPGRR